MDSNILAYAAGMLDADGCIQIMRKKESGTGCYSVRVSVSQATDIVPLWFQVNFGGRIDKIYFPKDNRVPSFRWVLESIKSKNFLEMILPFLVLKQERAKIAIEFQSQIGFKGFSDKLTYEVIETRELLFQKMKLLNSSVGSREYWKTN